MPARKKNKGSKSLVALENARTEKQHNHMARAAACNRCVFCEIDWKVNRELKRGKYWRVMPNAFPYPEHKHHIILTPIRHVTDPTQLTRAEMIEWWELNLWVIKKFKLPGGGIVMRFGDFKFNAGTIAHLHSHVQVPNGKRYSIAVFCKDPDFERFSKRTYQKWLGCKKK
jgi:diadenosine tetraphosphate (Ap4A) HIT family hydrolase